MAAKMYTTRHDGEMLDLICYDHYGQHYGAVEQVLAANPNVHALSRYPVLPAGVTFILPELDVAKTGTQLQKLWD